jgi:ABC-type Zn2+ transport system substrate-binding protein/surface adhesin
MGRGDDDEEEEEEEEELGRRRRRRRREREHHHGGRYRSHVWEKTQRKRLLQQGRSSGSQERRICDLNAIVKIQLLWVQENII